MTYYAYSEFRIQTIGSMTHQIALITTERMPCCLWGCRSRPITSMHQAHLMQVSCTHLYGGDIGAKKHLSESSARSSCPFGAPHLRSMSGWWGRTGWYHRSRNCETAGYYSIYEQVEFLRIGPHKVTFTANIWGTEGELVGLRGTCWNEGTFFFVGAFHDKGAFALEVPTEEKIPIRMKIPT
jgi:hypothetical protein